MNQELIEQFSGAPYGIIEAVYGFVGEVVLRREPGQWRIYEQLAMVPAGFYTALGAVKTAAVADARGVCDEWGIESRVARLVLDVRFWYHLTPVSLADFMAYCLQTIINIELTQTTVRRRINSVPKIKYNILFDVPKYAAYVSGILVPIMLAHMSGPMKKWIAEIGAVENFATLAEYVEHYCYAGEAEHADDSSRPQTPLIGEPEED